MEEWKIVALEQQAQEEGGTKRFSLQTGEDFLDCDLIGKWILQLVRAECVRQRGDNEAFILGIISSKGSKIVYGLLIHKNISISTTKIEDPPGPQFYFFCEKT